MEMCSKTFKFVCCVHNDTFNFRSVLIYQFIFILAAEEEEVPLFFENYNLTDIISPVKVPVLEGLLKESGYCEKKTEFLVNSFLNGFTIGYNGPKSNIRHFAPNLKIRVGSKVKLWNKVMTEVKLGRYAGPFDQVPFENFIQSPIGLVLKGNNGKDCRLIFHLSYPKDGMSVNSKTPKDLCTVKYPDFSEAVQLCVEAGVSCKIAKSDMSSAFRQLGVKAEHWVWLVLKCKSPIDGKMYYFVDKALPFGSSISCAYFQEFSRAIAWIVSFRTCKKNLSYLDDYFFVALLMMMCNRQVEQVLLVCKAVNFPVNMEKTFWATTKLTFLGLLLDTVNQVVCIPVEKVLKGRTIVANLLSKCKATVHQFQQLCGYLNFLCHCVVPGRAFTRRLYAATVGKCTLLKSHYHVNISGEVKVDLKVWQQFLHQPDIYCRPFMDFSKIWSAEELNFYTDSSKNSSLGMGGYCNSEWFAQPWDKQFIECNNPSIQYLELYVITAGVLAWIHKFRNQRVVIFTDNSSATDMINDSSSSCKNCMVLIRLIVLEVLKWNARIFAKHVRTNENGIADSLSKLQWCRFRKLTRKMNMSDWSTPISEEIWPMSKIW